MSKTVNADPLSELVRQLDFTAEVFFRDAYCGRWGIDTSGSQHVPFHLVAQGRAWLHGSGSPIALAEGDLLVFPRDDAHLLAGSLEPPIAADVNQPPKPPGTGPATRLICGFFKLDRRAAEPLLTSLPDTLIVPMGPRADRETRALHRWWLSEAAGDALGCDLAVDRLAELVFLQMLRTETAAARVTGLVAALADARIGPVLAAIHRDPGRDHRLSTLAQRARMSESAFAHRFRAAVGMRPGQYVRHWRMSCAARRLRANDRATGAIAQDCGYASEAAFRKAFQAFFGEPPGRYRRRFATT